MAFSTVVEVAYLDNVCLDAAGVEQPVSWVTCSVVAVLAVL